MDPFRQSPIVDSTDKEKAACSGLALLSKDQTTELMWNKTSLRKATIPFTDELRYLIPLWVSVIEETREELHVSDSSQSKICNQEASERIRATLKLLAFRDQHCLAQFWSASVVGKHRLLTTVDQPFGLGSPAEELFIYRKDSVRNFFLVDENHPEGDLSPPARVFRRGLPEWTPNITNYLPKDFAQQDCAVRCNLHGYLALPVFDSTTQSCVGVLELLMSSKNTSYAFEVQQIHKSLKTQNLRSPQVCDSSAPISIQRRRDEVAEIFSILKCVCDAHKLPLAQTWAVSPLTSFISQDNMIEKSCSSFNISCVGNVCMSATSLPFYVHDLSMWSFREACKEQHLDKSHSFVGRALSCGSVYCEDVTQLCEEEFPLIHSARTSGLRSCFAIQLLGIEVDDNYVLEFYLPFDGKGSEYVLNLVQTLKQNIVASMFELGEISPIQLTVPPTAASYLSSSVKPQAIGISSQNPNTLAFGMDSWEPEPESESESDSDSESESDLGSFDKLDFADVQSQRSSKEIHSNNTSNKINMAASRQKDNATSCPMLMGQKTNVTIIHAGETSKPLKRVRKRKIDSLTMSAIKQHVGKPISQAAESFGVSRSTLKRFCQENGIHSLPGPIKSKKTNHTDPLLSQEVMVKAALDMIKSKKTNHTHPLLSREVMVKAALKDDMIKFRFPLYSGLLELKNTVAQRFQLKGKINIKYKDEENDLLLITCDGDLYDLPEFLASNTNTTVKFVVELVPE